MPKRYWVERVWTVSRDGATIQGLLEQEQERSEWLKGEDLTRDDRRDEKWRKFENA